MGFRAKRTVYKLIFDDPDYAELEIKAASTSIGTLLDLANAAAGARAGAGLDRVDSLVDEFVGALKSWNLENEDGVPTPLTREGLLSHEPAFVLDILLTWFDAMMTVQEADPLAGRSTSGNQSLVVELPMDLPSPNLKN